MSDANEFPPASLTDGAPIETVDCALRSWFEELEGVLAGGADGAPWAREHNPRSLGAGWQPHPLFDARSISAAVYDRDGRRLAATQAFEAAGHQALLDPQQLSRCLTAREVLVEHGREEALVACAPASLTATWRLPRAIHEAGEGSSARVILLIVAAGTLHEALAQACRAYGMGGLQTRVALETIRSGTIKEAVVELDIAYQTARDALAEAMKRVGVQRLPGLVRRLTTLAFGVLPGEAKDDLLADAWGLSVRQVSIAGLVGEGLTRPQISRVLGLSEAVVKKELDVIFSLLQVTSAAALARKVVEARAFSWLMDTTAGGIGFVDDTLEPLRIAVDAHGRQIAYSDYGPSSGAPVLVAHSSMSTRIVSRRLLHALQKAGYRPIAIDRPGYGLTDPLPAGRMGEDVFADATADVEHVLDQLRIARVDVVSRGAAQFIWALARRCPERLARVVIVNPGPPYRASGRGQGPLAVIKDAFVKNPSVIEPMASFLAGQLTWRRIAKMMEQWTRGSPPDEAASRDPELVKDFYRSVRMFATGRLEGFIREQAALSRAAALEPLPGRTDWRVLIGRHDVLYDPEVVFAYWRDRLPGAHFRIIEDAGRFLIMTHPRAVVEELER